MDFDLMTQDKGLAIRERVEELEVACLEEEQVECPVYHHFSPGIYMREVHIKAGTFAIGHRQTTRHLNFFMKGKVNYVEADGSINLLEAPMKFVSDPGRKIGLVLEDMVWFNIYPTDETDIDTLEKTYLDKSDYFNSLKKQEVRQEDIDDFNKVLKENSVSHETVRTESERQEDLIPFPEGVSTVGVFDSSIEGKGLFTMSPIKKGDCIAPGRLGNKRTPAGRYVNHSVVPNATLVQVGSNVDFVALRDITGCYGGSMGEEITIDYREAINLKR